MKSYVRLLKFTALIKSEITRKIGISLIISVTYIIQAFSMAKAVTVVFQDGDAKLVVPFALTAIVCIFLRGLCSRFLDGYNKVVGAKIKNKIRLLVFDKILHLGPGYLGDKRSGRIQSLVLDGIESLEPFLVHYVPQMISICVTALGIAIYLAFLDGPTGTIAIVSVILCMVIPYLTVPMVWNSIVSYWNSYAVLNAQYIDSIQGMPTLMAFHASYARGEKLAEEAHDFYTKQIRNTSFSLMDSAVMLLMTSIAASVTAAVAAYRTGGGYIPVTTITTFLFLAAECARPLGELNNAWHSSFLGLSTAEEIFQIIDTELMTEEKAHGNSSAMENGLPGINFENVSFLYPTGTDKALKNVSLQIKPGQKAAIVGRSGSGKSTMLNLLLRFYEVTSGKILINGVDLSEYDLEYLRSKIGVVFQDTYLFNDTVLENIRMANPIAEKEAVIEAAKAAGAHEFISELSKGYDTILGERGVNLSGGERQRISIARAILKDAPLLILDEATSSVDAKSEALIQNTMDRLAKGKTSIVIAHRLSTVQNADVIFVLEKGKLAESGTHETLLAANGPYAELVRAQTKEGSYE